MTTLDTPSRTVSVLGLGNWGTSIANHLTENKRKVVGWSIQPEVVSSINSKGTHPYCLKEVPLRFHATTDLKEALQSDVIILAVASKAIGDVTKQIGSLDNKIIVSLIKGFEETSSLTPLQYLEKNLHGTFKTCVLSGPSFARDVSVHRPCGLVAASKDAGAAQTVAELFTAEWMKVYTSNDPLGVELGGAVKNVIAIAAGVSDGLNFGESARAGLITRGLAEITRLAVAMGAERQTLSGLSGLGDLSMTASSLTSRNYTVGFRLGQGETLSEILTSLGSVAEGVPTTARVLELSKKFKVEMPISEQVQLLLSAKISPKEMAKALLTRPIKNESI